MKDVNMARSEWKEEGGEGERIQNTSTTNENTHPARYEPVSPLSSNIPSPLASPVHLSLPSILKNEIDRIKLPENYKQLPQSELLLLTEKLVDFYQNINSLVHAHIKLEEEEFSEYAEISSTTDEEFSYDSTTTDDNSNSYDRISEVSEDLDLVKNSNSSFQESLKHDPASLNIDFPTIQIHSPHNGRSNALHPECGSLEDNLDSLPRKQASDDVLYDEETYVNLLEVPIATAGGISGLNKKRASGVLPPTRKPSHSPPPTPTRNRNLSTEQIPIPISNNPPTGGSSGNILHSVSNTNAAILSSPPRSRTRTTLLRILEQEGI